MLFKSQCMNCMLLWCHVHVSEWIYALCCLNVKELFAQNRRDIWRLSDCNRSWTRDHLVRKRTLNHLAKLAKWLSVRLQTKWLWVRIPLLSLKQYMKFEKMAAFSAIIVVEIWFFWDAFIAPPFFISFIISLDFTRLKVKSGLLLENFFAKILQWLQYYSTACKVGFRTLLVSDSQEFPICHYSDFFTSDKFVQKFLLYSLKTFN